METIDAEIYILENKEFKTKKKLIQKSLNIVRTLQTAWTKNEQWKEEFTEIIEQQRKGKQKPRSS